MRHIALIRMFWICVYMEKVCKSCYSSHLALEKIYAFGLMVHISGMFTVMKSKGKRSECKCDNIMVVNMSSAAVWASYTEPLVLVWTTDFGSFCSRKHV